MRYRYLPSPEQLLKGDIDLAVIKRAGFYIAWTRTWEVPPRPDTQAAVADLRDWLNKVEG